MSEILPVGIDLGTTNSVIARIAGESVPEVIPNAEGESITPSVVWIGERGVVVGTDAKEQMSEGNPDTAAFFKRHMGNLSLPFFLGAKQYSAVDLSAFVLSKLKRDAEERLGRPIAHAVITVPAYFEDPQRNATIAAGTKAGLDVLEIISEPTAAAFAYGLHQTGREENILVYDLGGGTFDVSIVRLTPQEFTVLATKGDHGLGGKDWDDILSDYVLDRFRDEFGVDPLSHGLPRGELLMLAETAKKTLSGVMSTVVNFHHSGHRLRLELTREDFESRTSHLMEATRSLCNEVLKDAGLNWQLLTGVLLVGGSTRMPMVTDYVRQMSGGAPLTGIHPDHAVAVGAAIRAARLLDERTPHKPRFRLPGPKKIQDVVAHPLGMISETDDGSRYTNSIIINKYLGVPCSNTRPFQLYTSPGNGNEMEVYLTQGESTDPVDCTVIARWHAAGIEHDPSGLQVIDVEYSYTGNMTVDATARLRSTGRAIPLTKESDLGDLSWIRQPPRRKGKGQHITAYLAVDLSGSMIGEGVATAQRAAREFVQQSDLSKCSIGIIEFADRVEVTCPACQDATQLQSAIAALGPHVLCSRVGGGNAATPFATAHQILRDVTGARFIIVLTDGHWYCCPQAIQESVACRNDGIQTIAVGTEQSNADFLKQISSSEAGSFYAKQHEVVGIFSSIARELTETAGGTKRALRLK